MDKVRTTTAFSIKRLTRDASATMTDSVMVQQNNDVSVTFVYTGLTGNTKVVNGKTWYEATGNWTFAPATVEITYGNTAKIKIKLDNNNSTNGWKIVQFIPKSTNPSGGPAPASADANGTVEFIDSNTVAGTYYYGLYLESQSQNQYASYDPVIQQDGGGDGGV